MKNMTLINIAQACQGKLCGADIPKEEVSGAVIDSRRLKEGNLFIAVRGEKADGHSFIKDVMIKGALAVVCEEEPAVEIPYILVKNSLQALKDMAIFYRSQLDIPIIGITGSVGKTGTKEFIAAVLGVRYQVLRTEGNFNNEIGLPLTVLKIRGNHQAAVLEMGINNFGEMHRLSEIAKPNIAVITNIGDCHLENLGSRSGVLKAKSEIFDFLADDGHILLNGDDEQLNKVDEVRKIVPLRFGRSKDNDLYATDIVNNGLDGTSITIVMKDVSFKADIFLPGAHMVYNALAATAVGRLLKMPVGEIKEGLGKVESIVGRSNIIHLANGKIIDDCYNANPISMHSALALLQSANGRKVAILGDMFELGEKEKEMHAEVGREAVTGGVDVLVCIGALSENMYEAAIALLGDDKRRESFYHFSNKALFIKAAKEIIRRGDNVLIKASHGMAFETLVEEIRGLLSSIPQ